MERAVFPLLLIAATLAAQPAVPHSGRGGKSPAPPAQPASGPGGTEYPHAGWTWCEAGEGAGSAWIIEPSEPKPESAAVVILLHGWMAVEPDTYGAWIRHLARRGNIVVYPRWQGGPLTPTRNFTPNAIQGVRAALAELARPGHVRPDPGRVASAGHSAGGMIAANLAALAASEKLPQPKAVLCLCPGKSENGLALTSVPLADLKTIPAGTLLLSVAAETDLVVGDHDARRIQRESVLVSREDKDFVVVPNDDHGAPALVADHVFPIAYAPATTADRRFGATAAARRRRGAERPDASVNALDWNGSWRLLDALCDAAFTGRDRTLALGGLPDQTSLGKWSDGVPVRPLRVSDP